MSEPRDTAKLEDRQGKEGHARRSKQISYAELLERSALPLLLVFTIVFFSFLGSTSETFPTIANLQIVVSNQSVLLLIALAGLAPLITNEYDLTVGAVAGLSSIATASVLSDMNGHLIVACLAGVGTGVLVGAINAFFVSFVGINSLIVTLAMSTVIVGLVGGYTGGEGIVTGIPSSLIQLGSGSIGIFPIPLIFIVIASFLLWYVLAMTPFGRNLAAIGSNRAAASLVGLRVNQLVAATFLLSGAIAGLAGVLLVARSGGASPQVGNGFTLAAFAALFLGATSIKPGRFNVLGTVVAVFFIAALTSGLTLAGAQGWVNDVVNGGALMVGVSVSTLVARRRGADVQIKNKGISET